MVIHMAGELVLAVSWELSWELSQAHGPEAWFLPLGPLDGLPDFLTAWQQGAKGNAAEQDGGTQQY